MADLFRIKRIGEECSDLPEAAGVDTVPELAQRNPTNPHSKLVEANEIKKRVHATPGLAAIEKWVSQEKTLTRTITY
jgi:hypothetical protein